MSIEPTGKMNTHALLNINYMIDLLMTPDGVSELMGNLESLYEKENRGSVLGDKEMILGTAALLNEVASNDNPMSDKMLRIFWNNTKVILKTKGII